MVFGRMANTPPKPNHVNKLGTSEVNSLQGGAAQKPRMAGYRAPRLCHGVIFVGVVRGWNRHPLDDIDIIHIFPLDIHRICICSLWFASFESMGACKLSIIISCSEHSYVPLLCSIGCTATTLLQPRWNLPTKCSSKMRGEREKKIPFQKKTRWRKNAGNRQSFSQLHL